MMRRGDYLKGQSLGVRAATRQAILKAVESRANRNKTTIKAVILFIKDSGLRASDARLLNYGDIAERLEREDSVISIPRITEKQKTVAKTFIGEEAINALKAYIDARRKGSQKVPPENISHDSPLFRTWENGKVKRILRGSLSSLVRQAFLRVDEANLSPHSLRKFLQTSLEEANVNANWIDQILGHKLINSRDAYSKPSDEQLKQPYTNAYDNLRVYPKIATSKPNGIPTTQIITNNNETQTIGTDDENYPVAEAGNMTEVKQLLAKGYKFELEMEGVKLFVKK